MKKSFRFKNILMVIVLAFIIFLGGNLFLNNSLLNVSNNSQGIMSIQETK
ncbi:hypothetical protein [Clostridium sp. B9]